MRPNSARRGRSDGVAGGGSAQGQAPFEGQVAMNAGNRGERVAEPHGERIGRVEVRLEQVEEGVANFRAFQLENREFMGWFKSQEEDRAKIDKRRSKIHFALLTLLIGLIVALFSFLMEHYDRNHSMIAPFATQSQSAPVDASATSTHF